MRRSHPSFIDITGKTFSRLTAISRIASKGGRAVWICRCKCGRQAVVSGKQLRSGKTKSCGCLSREITSKRNFKHGMASRINKHPLYSSWCRIKQRCYNPNCGDYYLYGADGVKMCDRWKTSFENFCTDILSTIGPRQNKTSLDRFPDKCGHYEPGNVRWGTDEMQANNKRNNVTASINGKTMTIAQWSREIGTSPGSIHSRIKRGWTPEEAVSVSIRPVRKHPVRRVMTDEKIQELISNPETSGREFARKFGVSASLICSIRRKWLLKHA